MGHGSSEHQILENRRKGFVSRASELRQSRGGREAGRAGEEGGGRVTRKSRRGFKQLRERST
jgi:hypothetical protein